MNNAIYTSSMETNLSVVYMNNSLDSFTSNQPVDLTQGSKTWNKQVYGQTAISRKNDPAVHLHHVGNTHLLAVQDSAKEDKTDKNPLLRLMLNNPPAPFTHRIRAHKSVQTASYEHHIVPQSGKLLLKP